MGNLEARTPCVIYGSIFTYLGISMKMSFSIENSGSNSKSIVHDDIQVITSLAKSWIPIITMISQMLLKIFVIMSKTAL